MQDQNQLQCCVVIPTRGRADSLQQVLTALRLQTTREFEVIVVVDGDDSATHVLSASFEAEFPLRWVFLPVAQGQANARNIGAQAAIGNFIAFLDDDTLPAPEWLERHLLAHVADSEWTRVVRGKTWHSFGPSHSTIERFLRDERVRTDAEFSARAADVTIRECCVGVNCSLSRQAFLDAAGFDAKLKDMDEDMELGARMFLRGARFVYEPGAMVEHRDTKRLTDYHLRCWRIAAATDVYRMTVKGDRTAQVRALTRLSNGNRLQRTKERWAWNQPEGVKRAADRARRLAEGSGSRSAARVWRSLISSAEYWDEVRKVGLNADSLRENVGCPTVSFAFHNVGPLEHGDDRAYCISTAKFSRMMEWLSSRGYECATPGAVAGRPRTFELTFDDAYDQLYTEVLPHVGRWALKPLVFVVAGQIGGWNAWDEGRAPRRRLLDVPQMRELQGTGVQFGSHTLTHPDLRRLDDAALRREVRQSKAKLEDELGSEVSAFAYPYGCVDERVRAAVGEAGYKRAYTTYPGRNWFGDPLLLKRVEVGEADTMSGFAHKARHGASPRDRFASHLPDRAKRVLRMLL